MSSTDVISLMINRTTLRRRNLIPQHAQSNPVDSSLLRHMGPCDIPQVKLIDRQAFPTVWPPPPFRRDITNNSSSLLVAIVPTSDGQFPLETPSNPTSIRRRLAQSLQRLIPSWVLDRQNTNLGSPDLVLGYVSIWKMGSDAHITAIAVDETYQQRGIGELLLIGTIISSLELGLECVTLEVRESNSVAQKLYTKYGFERVGIRKRYYRDNNEDALIMTTKSIASPDYQRLFLELTSTHKNRWGYGW